MSNSFNEKLQTEIWEAVNAAGMNPESAKGQDIIAFRMKAIRELILSEIVGQDEKSVIPRLYKLFKPRNELRAEQRNKILNGE